MKAHGGVAAGATGVTANWTQTYTYDRYGNKTATSVSGDLEDTTRAPRDGLSLVSVNTATNRVNTSGWEYDLTGNLIRGRDVSNAWQRFEYDAAGRLVKIKNDSNVVLETYTYGASRERLVTENSSFRRYYVWGGSSVVAEYTESTASTTPDYAKSYVYAGSRLLATYAPTSTTKEAKQYHHPDRLGTQLVTTGASTSYRQTTFPFGTTISAETTGNSNQIFTSYDRSTTTGLDYAQNRTYSQGQSRFTQVDPIGMSSASLGNPQSNNLYAYVQNMPSDFVDPSGLLIIIARGYNCRMVELRDGSTGLVCERIEYTFWDDNPSGGPVGPPVQSSSGGGGITDSRGGDDCIPGLPCINFVKEAKKRWPAIEKCLQDARDMAIGALNDLRSRLPFDGVWASQVAVGAAGGGYLGKVPGALIGAGTMAYPRVSERVAGWYQIHWAWQAAIKNCGVRERDVPRRIGFPY